MKTVEIVPTMSGCFVTRKYYGQTRGREFFFSTAPDRIKNKKQFIKEQEEAKQRYISMWVDT